jgi:hypothetical protein
MSLLLLFDYFLLVDVERHPLASRGEKGLI